MAEASGSGGSGIDTGLAYKGIVSAVPAVGQFTVPSFIGLGSGKFDGFTNPYSIFVFRKGDGSGGAPQGEIQSVLAFNSNTGNVTAAAFTLPVSVDDEVMLLHPSIAGILSAGGGALFAVAIAQIMKLNGVVPLHGSVVANWNAGEQVICTIGGVGIRNKVQSAIVDIMATSGNITIRMYISVNGNQRKIFPPKAVTFSTPAGDAPGIAVINGTFEIANLLTITGQSDAPGDNGVAIAYEYALEPM